MVTICTARTNPKELPTHLFVDSSDGDLYDTRTANWHKLPPLRPNYQRGRRSIDTVADLKAVLRSGQWAWPGGYPLYFVVDDGEAMSFQAVRQELRQVMAAIQQRRNDGWRVIGCEVNHEDAELRCCHTNELIESAAG